MEKKEPFADLELKRWIIVHETPLMGWLGRIDATYFEAGASGWNDDALMRNLINTQVTLRDAVVMQTSAMFSPAPGGGMQMNVMANALAPYTFMTEGLQVTLVPRAVTLAWTLVEQDRKQLLDKLEAIRSTMLAQRAKSSGLVLPGGRA